MPRFFCDNASFSQKTLRIENPDEVHHIKDVLRLKRGDKIQIFNTLEQEADAVIDHVSARGVEVAVLTVRRASETKGLHVTLACAIPKRAKFESIIEKCTELGVSEIIPLKTERTELSLNEERLLRKSERYRKVAINAAKQCRRSSIPVIHPVTPLLKVLENLGPETAAFIPSLLGDRQPLRTALNSVSAGRKIIFFIGPEGDFTEDEVRSAVRRGCVPVTLGATTLKVDTAAVTVIACAQMMFQV